MNILKSPVFILCVVLFILHQFVQKTGYLQIAFLDAYLDCFLAMPVILTLLLAERQWLFKKGYQYRLSPLMIVMATAYIIMVTEILFPIISTNFTADWLDVVFYIAGSILFHYTINKPSAKYT